MNHQTIVHPPGEQVAVLILSTKYYSRIARKTQPQNAWKFHHEKTAKSGHQHGHLRGKLPVSEAPISSPTSYHWWVQLPTRSWVQLSGCLALEIKKISPPILDMFYITYSQCGCSGISDVGKRYMSTSLHRFRISPFLLCFILPKR